MPATLSIRGLYIINESLFSGMVMPNGMTTADRDIIKDNILNEFAELEVIYPDPIFMQDAIAKWSRKEVGTWGRIYRASIADYNPIENYNRMEETTESGENSRTQTTTQSEGHTGTDTETHSGKDIDAHSGTDTNTSTLTNTHTGLNSDTNSGSDVVTTNKAGFDSNTLVTTETNTTQHGHVVSTSISESVSESGSASLAHGEKIETLHGHTVATQHGETVSTSGNVSESGDNSVNRRSHITGNIGVTTSQQMLEQELVVSAKLNVYNYIMESFKDRFCLEIY